MSKVTVAWIWVVVIGVPMAGVAALIGLLWFDFAEVGVAPAGRLCSAKIQSRSASRAIFPRLGEREQHSDTRLSGGEQRRLAIGRALMTNECPVLFDEATERLAPPVGHCRPASEPRHFLSPHLHG
jgi:hypothetical protein